MGYRVAQGLRTAVGQLEKVHVMIRRTVGGRPRSIRSILGRERHSRIGKVIELRESGVDVRLFLSRRGRIVGGAAEKQQDDFAIRMFQLVQQTAQAISKIDNEATTSPSGRCEHENSRPIVAQRQARLADGLIENVRMSDLLD